MIMRRDHRARLGDRVEQGDDTVGDADRELRTDLGAAGAAVLGAGLGAAGGFGELRGVLADLPRRPAGEVLLARQAVVRQPVEPLLLAALHPQQRRGIAEEPTLVDAAG